ncbi:bel1-like homeodomain protein 4 [Quercus suber]|uniref:Bel1-like homeodomain protein 4 n=1 Tax=Quercus suber TaxID=58331 RepID=A0AAW0L6J3_QUESU
MANNNTTTIATTMSDVVSTTHDSDMQHNNTVSTTTTHSHRAAMAAAEDTCRRGSVVAAEFGTISGNADIGSTLIRFGTTAGDVSLTLGLRHAGNMPEKSSSFSVRDFGDIHEGNEREK